jgi:hypothetical protein
MMEQPLNDREIKAMISLLEEPDEKVFQEIMKQMIVLGPDLLPQLEEEWGRTNNQLQQDRLLAIIRKLHIESLYQQLLMWTSFHANDLWRGYLTFHEFLYSGDSGNKLFHHVNKIKRDLAFEMHPNLTALQKVKILNHIFFGVHKFKVNRKPEAFIKSHFLPSLFDTKTGTPHALGLLYMHLAQEFGLPVYGIALPGHFILAYMKADFPGENAFKSETLFYINPAHNGVIFTRKEIEKFLKAENKSLHPFYFRPNRAPYILGKIIDQLISGYENEPSPDYIEELEYLKEALGEYAQIP